MSTKELILEEALKQFSEKGFAGTSMSDIAKPLGITKAALYKHFKSKQQIFDEIISESGERFKDIFEELSVHISDNPKEEMNVLQKKLHLKDYVKVFFHLYDFL